MCSEQLRDQLHAQLREQLHAQVREQLHAQLHQWSMGEQLREQLCGQLRAVSSCVSLQGADTSREQPHE